MREVWASPFSFSHFSSFFLIMRLRIRIQVETEMHYTHNGSFSITLSRLSDGKRLVQRSFDDIDLWRKGAISIRNKFGIYRSFGKTLTDENDRPTNGIKDEHILLADFKVYEKNTNPDPQPHD